MDVNFCRNSCPSRVRQSLAAPVSATGKALHAGTDVQMTLKPAAPGAGRVFVRSDLDGARIPARFDLVGETRLGTFLNVGDARVGMIEHLMAALSIAQIDDAEIWLEGAEPPVLDGSAVGYLALIDRAGVQASDMPREVWQVLRPVMVGEGGVTASLSPADEISMDFVLDYPDAVIGHQAYGLPLTPDVARTELAPARTFGFVRELEALHKMGLARGAGLENTLAFTEAGAMNPEGMRFSDECVRHKLLDVVGDLSLAGAPLIGAFRGIKSGHTLNNVLLKSLFADPENVRKVVLS